MLHTCATSLPDALLRMDPTELQSLETILAALLLCVRKGGRKEANLACMAVTVLAITLGGSNDDFYGQVREKRVGCIKKKCDMNPCK